MKNETKLTRDQIIPVIDTTIRCAQRSNSFMNISPCHRLIGTLLLRRYYTRSELDCIKGVYNAVPYSSETTRRAVRDGVRMGVIDQTPDPKDRRRKLIKASYKLIAHFESEHLESESTNP